jgi:uncharacterized membrane protein
MSGSHPRRFPLPRTIMRWLLAALFFAAGLAHVLTPDGFLKITPEWVPFAREVIFITGLCEICGAAALLTRSLRYWAGIALALYALCVWPANFKHAFDGIDVAHIPSSWWYHGPRLALQPVVIWLALFAGEVVDWPFRRGDASGRVQRR